MNPTEANRGRQRAQRLFETKECDLCRATNKRLERHHKDANPLNNDPDNVQILCVRCHMKEDGRLAAGAERLRTRGRRAPRIYKGTVCTVSSCDREAKYRGLCNSHYYRARNNGWNPGTAPVREYRKSK